MGRKRVDFVLPPGRLWPNAPSGTAVAIEVIGLTGEYQSGKTIFAGSVAPGTHPEGHAHAGKPRTLLLDFEKSGATFGGFGWQRIDVPAEMVKAFTGADGQTKQYHPLDVFRWFRETIHKIPPGRFDVVIVDPVSDIDDGLVAYVRKNPGEFGYTADQFEKASGLLWGAVKNFWKTVLLEAAAKCQSFLFTSHLRDEWIGNRPTMRREPKGKETLMELASLYLWLERKPDEKGIVADVPSATVLKQRLTDVSLIDGRVSLIPLLPPRIECAIPDEIRRYIVSPPNYDSLKEYERVVQSRMSADERLVMETQKAEAERDTEVARSARTARMAELQGMAAAKPATPDITAATQAAKAEVKAEAAIVDAEQAAIDAKLAMANAQAEEMRKRGEALRSAIEPPRAATSAPSEPVATAEDCQQIAGLCKELGYDGLKIATMLAAARAKDPTVAERIHELRKVHVVALLKHLVGAAERKRAGASQGN